MAFFRQSRGADVVRFTELRKLQPQLPRKPLTPTHRRAPSPHRIPPPGSPPPTPDPAASLLAAGAAGTALPGFFPRHSAHSNVRSPSARSHRSSCNSSTSRAPPTSSAHSPQPHDMAAAARRPPPAARLYKGLGQAGAAPAARSQRRPALPRLSPPIPPAFPAGLRWAAPLCSSRGRGPRSLVGAGWSRPRVWRSQGYGDKRCVCGAEVTHATG